MFVEAAVAGTGSQVEEAAADGGLEAADSGHILVVGGCELIVSRFAYSRCAQPIEDNCAGIQGYRTGKKCLADTEVAAAGRTLRGCIPDSRTYQGLLRAAGSPRWKLKMDSLGVFQRREGLVQGVRQDTRGQWTLSKGLWLVLLVEIEMQVRRSKVRVADVGPAQQQSSLPYRAVKLSIIKNFESRNTKVQRCSL